MAFSVRSPLAGKVKGQVLAMSCEKKKSGVRLRQKGQGGEGRSVKKVIDRRNESDRYRFSCVSREILEGVCGSSPAGGGSGYGAA